MSAPGPRTPEIDAAAESLYGAPLDQFTTERKRLADERKRAGDKAGAATITKLGKPNLSAWAINQLYRHARVELDALFAVGEQLREGDLSATGEHQVTLNRVRARGAELLTAAGHAASETTLRRVTMTLQALSATGTFEPDPPGQLVGDRDPPGFEAHAGMAISKPSAPTRPAEPGEARERTREHERLTRELERRERDAEKALRDVATCEEDVAAALDKLTRVQTALSEARGRADEAAREVAAARERMI